jgi:cyclic pyranopterin phosphate synthase
MPKMGDTTARPFSHLDKAGRARMVDVSAKPVTRRVAEASCRVVLSAATAARLAELPKGDAVAVARLAGIQGAKRTSELVPLAHPLPLDQVEIEVEPAAAGGVTIRSRVVATARTGAELEALTACATAALALYDMVKAVERGAVITDLRLEAKSGGASGDYRRDDAGPAATRRRPLSGPRRVSISTPRAAPCSTSMRSARVLIRMSPPRSSKRSASSSANACEPPAG